MLLKLEDSKNVSADAWCLPTKACREALAMPVPHYTVRVTLCHAAGETSRHWGPMAILKGVIQKPGDMLVLI